MIFLFFPFKPNGYPVDNYHSSSMIADRDIGIGVLTQSGQEPKIVSEEVNQSGASLSPTENRQNSSLVQLEQSSKLTRFLQKLLTEILNLQADACCFTLEAEKLKGSISKNNNEIKSLEISAQWFAPLLEYLHKRSSVFNEQSEFPLSALDLKAKEVSFYSALRLGDQIVCLRVQRNVTLNKRHQLRLSELRFLPLSRALEQLGWAARERINLEKVLNAGAGIFIAAAPDVENLFRTKACLLSLGQWYGHAEASEAQSALPLIKLAASEPVLISLRADDGFEALSRFFEVFPEVNRQLLLGALSQGLARKICAACSRESVLDPKLAAQLPTGYKPEYFSSYKIGRGCEQCGQSGYRGLIGVQSLALLDTESRAMLAAPSPDQPKQIERLRAFGLRSLFEDGAQKITQGLITLEALYNINKTIQVYHQRFLQKETIIVESESGPALAADFEAQVSVNAKPLTGRAAFTGNEADSSSDDAPLFLINKDGKVRAKPLILVVEDDADQRSILEMVFRSAQYDLAVAKDGSEALKRVEENTPDIIVTDLMMPLMDGAELVKKLKQHPNHKDIPVLILTVLNDSDKEYALLDLGADDYCEKTIQRKVLLKRVEKLVRRNLRKSN